MTLTDTTILGQSGLHTPQSSKTEASPPNSVDAIPRKLIYRIWTRRLEFKSWTSCISHSTNTLGKGMNPIILPPAMGK